ncbi:MAG: hypothetical protein V4471_05095 [Pseudomonadota bacterium]
MPGLKVIAVIVSIAIASLAYILLTRYFPSEEVFFMGSRPLTRALVVDLKIKSNKDFSTFLPENSGFLVLHPSKSPEDHREDILETRDFFALLAKTNKNTIQTGDDLYPELEILFLKNTLVGLRANYVTLSSLGIKSIFFNSDYLAQFSELYQDKLPHAAGYTVMADGSQRLIHDILVK